MADIHHVSPFRIVAASDQVRLHGDYRPNDLAEHYEQSLKMRNDASKGE